MGLYCNLWTTSGNTWCCSSFNYSQKCFPNKTLKRLMPSLVPVHSKYLFSRHKQCNGLRSGRLYKSRMKDEQHINCPKYFSRGLPFLTLSIPKSYDPDLYESCSSTHEYCCLSAFASLHSSFLLAFNIFYTVMSIYIPNLLSYLLTTILILWYHWCNISGCAYEEAQL